MYFSLRFEDGPWCRHAASGSPLLFDQCGPFAILKPKNRIPNTSFELSWEVLARKIPPLPCKTAISERAGATLPTFLYSSIAWQGEEANIQRQRHIRFRLRNCICTCTALRVSHGWLVGARKQQRPDSTRIEELKPLGLIQPQGLPMNS